MIFFFYSWTWTYLRKAKRHQYLHGWCEHWWEWYAISNSSYQSIDQEGMQHGGLLWFIGNFGFNASVIQTYFRYILYIMYLYHPLYRSGINRKFIISSQPKMTSTHSKWVYKTPSVTFCWCPPVKIHLISTKKYNFIATRDP